MIKNMGKNVSVYKNASEIFILKDIESIFVDTGGVC